MAISRRAVLTTGLAGTGLLALGSVGLGLRGTVMREPRMALVALTPQQFSVLAAVAETLLPGVDELGDGWALLVPEKVDQLLGACEPWLAEEVGTALLLLENALPGLLLDGRPTTFSAAAPAARAATLERWRTSSIALRRSAFKALHGLCAGSYYSDPASRQLTGYPGPPDFGNTRGAYPHPPLQPEPELPVEPEEAP